MDDATWQVCQIMMAISGIQTAFIVFILGIVLYKMGRIEDKLISLETKIQSIETRIAVIDSRLTSLETIVGRIPWHLGAEPLERKEK